MSFMEKLFNVWGQSFFIPAPPLTGKELGDQSGRVFIVTGGYAGVGKELVQLLYSKNATVYIAGRTKKKAAEAIMDIEDAVPISDGRIEFLLLDLSDLVTIKKSAETFMKSEQRLDVLVNNAGVMMPPKGSKTEEGYELQMGTNCLGPFLFTQQLLPILKKTAAMAPPNSVRVTWAASITIDFAPVHGVEFDKKGMPVVSPQQQINYAQSKAGNVFLASEFARRYAQDGILSVSFNPGNLRTELQRHTGILGMILNFILCYPAVFGAYTELFAGWSPLITSTAYNGGLVVPWGRPHTPRQGLLQALRGNREGGYGIAEKFWDWCAKETSRWVTEE
ncbi:uncharacterized protein K452DRAFT_251337 [Aplosporella prunicola CBS 121167]|uniref:Ketoreductase (KR) domain-containing protein n=1 Tax=Aplosporella prunicola CBS 121167 TaxID=1176127 RepID=A0A6A6BEQ5_9PEZI|nr:uncharacterized protein K452DRAFT_251337 [Aplosporella prunicola CBS 121167]KAF2141407.1 hypothetical protein K452DRAFT_251337 [Aplosporella prunicola CBS 121167]